MIIPTPAFLRTSNTPVSVDGQLTGSSRLPLNGCISQAAMNCGCGEQQQLHIILLSKTVTQQADTSVGQGYSQAPGQVQCTL